jgi:GTP-binding protein EngB required for normal cell division
MAEYLRNARSLHRSMLLVDLKLGLLPADLLLMELLVETTKPFSVVLTKVDKVKPGLIESQV